MTQIINETGTSKWFIYRLWFYRIEGGSSIDLPWNCIKIRL
jgi:hypothetical protein